MTKIQHHAAPSLVKCAMCCATLSAICPVEHRLVTERESPHSILFPSYLITIRSCSYGPGLYSHKNPALAHHVAISDEGHQTQVTNYVLIQCRVVTREKSGLGSNLFAVSLLIRKPATSNVASRRVLSMIRGRRFVPNRRLSFLHIS